MKITVTINLGNYENIKIESNDYPTADNCVSELINVIKMIPSEKADSFVNNYLIGWLENLLIEKQ